MRHQLLCPPRSTFSSQSMPPSSTSALLSVPLLSSSSSSTMAPIVKILKLMMYLLGTEKLSLREEEGGNSNGKSKNMDLCCWVIGYVCSFWWFCLFIYWFLPAGDSGFGDRPGVRLKREGLRDYHPVVFVPGVFAGELELWEGKRCADGLFRRRIWGGGFGDIYKRPQCWMDHMVIDNDTGLDPPGVRVRPVPGLVAAEYFMGLIENLASIGYEGKNMYMASYDWRLFFQNTEVRDKSLSILKSKIELMVKISRGRKVVVVPYSSGALYFLHFLKWVEAPSPMGGGGGPQWCSHHIKAIMNVGPAFLGVPVAMNGIFSTEAKEMVSSIRAMSHGVLDPNILGFRRLQQIIHVSRAWDSMHYLSPNGGDAIWGSIHWSIQESLGCDRRNKRNAITSLQEKPGPGNSSDGKMSSWVNVMARCARIIFFRKLPSWSSFNLPFHDSKKLLVDSALLERKSPESMVKKTHDEIDDGVTGVTENKITISSTIRDASCLLPPETVQHTRAHFSHGIADDLADPKYSHYKYWSNPLETKLPDAPNIEIYCLYGADPSTESSKANGILTLLSSGFMCAKGWRGNALFNPSGMPTYVREYRAKTSPARVDSNKRDYYMDIMNNEELIEDIMRVVAGASGKQIGGDQYYSNILNISHRVRLHPG